MVSPYNDTGDTRKGVGCWNAGEYERSAAIPYLTSQELPWLLSYEGSKDRFKHFDIIKTIINNFTNDHPAKNRRNRGLDGENPEEQGYQLPHRSPQSQARQTQEGVDRCRNQEGRRQIRGLLSLKVRRCESWYDRVPVSGQIYSPNQAYRHLLQDCRLLIHHPHLYSRSHKL